MGLHMTPDLVAILLFAVDEGPGRGDNPSAAGGILLVLGIALAVVALAVLGLALTGQLKRLRAGARQPLREGHTNPSGPDASD
jgi:hypothetical protein